MSISIGNKLLSLINILLGFLWFLAYLSDFINPQSFPILALFAIAYPLLVISHILMFLYWLLKFKKTIYISGLILVLSYFNSSPVLTFQSKTKALAKDESFSILSYNCQQFYYKGGAKDSVKNIRNSISHFITQQNADVVCLQEARLSIANLLKYPYKSQVGFNHFYSKYPILLSKALEFESNSSNISAYADILIHNDTFRVYNLHLESIHLASNDLQLIDNWEGTDKQEQIKKNTEALSAKISLASVKRAAQVDFISQHISDTPYQSIVCGDFNDVPYSYIYKNLKSGFKDAFIECGKGFGATYRKLFFPFRIDYILHPSNWNSYNFMILEEKLSDHQAIRCDIEIN